MVVFSPVQVNLLGIKINTLDNASVMNIGPTLYIDQYISYKRNQGYGEQNGDLARYFIPISYVFDGDFNDSSSAKNSII